MKVSRWLKKMILISFVSLFCAGIGYWLSHLFLRQAGEFGDEPHILERLFGPAHLVAALIFIFTMGIVWSQHVRFAVRIKRHRFTGWLFFALLTALAITGIAIVYGSEALIKRAESLHPWLGLSLLPTLLGHWHAKKWPLIKKWAINLR